MLKPFGYSYLLDAYKCRIGSCDDLELHYRFLEEIVHRLKMTPMGIPVVIHAPCEFKNDKRVELYPDKSGVSGWIPLITSGIQIHSCEEKRFSTIDVYSCNKFDKDEIRNFFHQMFGFEKFEEHWVERGKEYNNE